MKNILVIMIVGAFFFTGCANYSGYQAKMTPRVEKIELGKPIPLEAGLLITEETRNQIFKSPPYPDYKGNFIVYSIEPYRLPIGQAFEDASLKIFSQIFEKVHLIRNAQEGQNYPVVIEPKLSDFNLSLFYFRHGLYIYDELVDGQCSVKVTGTLLSQGRPIWQKSIETPLETNHWVNSHWLIDNVSELASDTIVLALKELAFLMERESQEPSPPVKGWLEGIGGKQ
jgi:hypothetical protein